MSSKSNIHSTIFRKMFITYHPSNPTLSFDTLVIFRHLQVFTVIFRTSWYVSYHQSSFDLRYLSVNLIMFRSYLSFGQCYVSTTSIFRHYLCFDKQYLSINQQLRFHNQLRFHRNSNPNHLYSRHHHYQIIRII